jgi:DNA-binding helix-hairpin-helix protein with protein kinase domain
MATKKPAAKTAAKTPAKTTRKPLAKKAGNTGAMHMMPVEVSNWIDRAMSTINHQKGEIERLKTEITELKAYRRWAEQRILRSDHE